MTNESDQKGRVIPYPSAVDEGDESCDHRGRHRGPRALVRRPAHVILKINLTTEWYNTVAVWVRGVY